MKQVVEVVEYTDPYCTWCWGAEPILRKIKELYGDQVKIVFKMGGLVEDIGDFYDPLNMIGGEGMFEQVAAHWEDASRRHGMPVDGRVFRDLANEFRSTYPANIAYKAAQMQSQELAEKLLRRMREAAAAERMALHQREVQVELAREVGMDVSRFVQALEDSSAERAFYEDLKECRGLGITGFPTFLIKNRQGESLFLNGYRRFEAFENVFRHLAGDALVRRAIEPTDESIIAFIRKYGKVATREVAEVFELKDDQAEKTLRALESGGKTVKVTAGNGYFWVSKKSSQEVEIGRNDRPVPLDCDPETGRCVIPAIDSTRDGSIAEGLTSASPWRSRGVGVRGAAEIPEEQRSVHQHYPASEV